MLGFEHFNVIFNKEQSGFTIIKSSFEGRNVQNQYIVLGYRIDLDFMTIKLQQKLMKMATELGLLLMKEKYRKQQNKNLVYSN